MEEAATPGTGLPLQGGTLPSLPGNASPQEIITVVNDIVLRLNNQLQSQTLGDDSNKRIIFGYQQGGFPDGNIGMKISLPGIDVTAATISELLFMWDFTSGTMYWYDPTTNKNYMQAGILPNGIGGWVSVLPGFNVSDAISS